MLTIKRLWTAVVFYTLSLPCQATVMTFTDPGQFSSVLASSGVTANTIDFDLATSNTVISDGDQFDGVEFGFSDAGGTSLDGMIASDFSTVSGNNYLGFNSPGSSAFLSGDIITMGFSQPIQALGLYLIASPGDFGFDDDAVLSAGNAAASNGNSPNQVLADGSEAFFIGLIDRDGFDFAELTTLCCGFFEFTLDSIMFANFQANPPPLTVSSPATWAMLMLSLPALGLNTRRRSSHR